MIRPFKMTAPAEYSAQLCALLKTIQPDKKVTKSASYQYSRWPRR